MTTSSHLRLANLALLSLAVATLAACGGGSESDTSTAAAPVGASSPTPSPGQVPTPPAPTPPQPPPPPPPGPSPAPPPAPPPPAPAPIPPTLGSATLQWSPAADPRVVGYRVYWGTAPGTYNQALGAGTLVNAGTSHVVANLQAGSTYYFAVTSQDGNGTESAFSAEASKTIP